jgi:hypothetical protein
MLNLGKYHYWIKMQTSAAIFFHPMNVIIGIDLQLKNDCIH